DVRETEAASDDPAVAEQLLDLMRMGRRSDVDVLRAAAEQQIAHAAADQICGVVMFVEPVQDFEGVGIDVAPRNRVSGSRNDGRFHHRRDYSIRRVGDPDKYQTFKDLGRSLPCATIAGCAASCLAGWSSGPSPPRAASARPRSIP